MSDAEDLFSKRKRKNPSSKRKKRQERLSFAEDSESDDEHFTPPPQEKPSFKSSLTKSTKRKPRSKPFGVPKNSVISEKKGIDADSEEELKPDYSTRGLELLREETASKPKEGTPPSTLSVEKEPEIDLGPEIQEKKDDSVLADVRNATYISLDRDITEQKLGGALDLEAISASDPMVINTLVGNSEEDEWEREQLKRVGIPVSSLMDGAATETKNTRAIIEEEDMQMGVRGEIGVSAADTCLECISDELEQTDNHIDLVNSKMGSIRVSVDKSLSVLEIHDAAIAAAKERETFYQTFSRFAGDISEMLSELQPKISKFYSKRKGELAQAAAAVEISLSQTVDEFGRTVDLCDTVLKEYGHLDNMLSPMMRDIGEFSEAESPFEDVHEEFVSLERISGLFRDWKRRFPDDYAKAYGDLSVGKIAGAIAMGMSNCEDLEWIFCLSGSARSYAIEASHVSELLIEHVLAHWKPSSRQSTKRSYKKVRDLTENVTAEGKGSVFARNSIIGLYNSFLKRLNFESQFLRHACSDPETPKQLLRKSWIEVVACSVLFYTKAFEAQSVLSSRSGEFLKVLLGGVTSGVASLSEHLEKTTERLELWVEILEAFFSCKCRLVSGDMPEWEPIRTELRSLLKVQPSENISSRMRVCFDKIFV